MTGQGGRVDLLADIQAAATDPAIPLSSMLRKCQILAARLRHQPFKEWVAHELNGYPNESILPVYRGPFWGELKADVRGFGGGGYNNVGVPTTNIPEPVREDALTMRFFQGVGMLENLIADAQLAGETRVMKPFSAELAAMTPVLERHQTMRMWLEVPIASVSGILDQVRNRALEFTLEIEAENPRAGEATPGGEPPVPVAQMNNIFNTVILGGQVSVGPGATVNVTPGDLGSLLRYLEEVGVETADRNALAEAIDDDDRRLGPRVKAWLGEMAMKAAASGGRIGEAAAGGSIAFAVAKFLGIA